MLNDTIILLSDSYKVSHYRQYPPGTEPSILTLSLVAAAFLKRLSLVFSIFLNDILQERLLRLRR